MAFLDAHALGYKGTLKLSTESKAERVSAHLDHVSKGVQPQMQVSGERGRRAGFRADAARRCLLQLHASSYSLAQCLPLEKTSIQPDLAHRIRERNEVFSSAFMTNTSPGSTACLHTGARERLRRTSVSSTREAATQLPVSKVTNSRAVETRQAA